MLCKCEEPIKNPQFTGTHFPNFLILAETEKE